MILPLQQFFQNTNDCVVTELSDGLSIRAKSQNESDLQDFQFFARSVIDGAGKNYYLPLRPHILTSYSVDYIGSVVIKWL